MKQISIYFENKNENETVTLAEMAEQVENQGESLKVAQFEDFAAFRSYFNIHYRPLLERISNGEQISDNDRHLLNFLASDLQEAFGETDEDDDTEDFGVMLVTFADAENYEHAKRIFDSTGESDFWAGDYDDQTRTVEFTESGDLDALETALSAEMTKYGISGYTFNSHRVRV